jgi:mannosyl-glycoprotein endo-beta-N-acetylglucosaminidase
MVDHAQLLVNGTTDNPQRYATVVQATDYKTAANGLVDGGYATDPAYANKIIQMIETYHLYRYDNK